MLENDDTWLFLPAAGRGVSHFAKSHKPFNIKDILVIALAKR